MPYYKATATLKAASGFPEDDVVNTICLYRETAPTSDATWNNWTDIFHTFYNNGGSPMQDVKQFLSPEFDRLAGIDYRFYDITTHLDGSPHGSPLFVANRAVTGSAPAAGLPAEVAVTLTLRGSAWEDQLVEAPDGGDAGSEVDRPRQRYSGRIFIGPLATTASGMVNGRARPVADLIGSVLYRAEAMYNSFQASTVGWHVWSRKDATARLITHIQVDDAFDTQRRRGVAPSARTTTNLAD